MVLRSWGANSHGQLGLKLISEQIDKPTEVPLDNISNISTIACGGGHSLLLDCDGKLYACGWNHKFQLGDNIETPLFQRVWALSGIRFCRLACGWDFSCAVTDDNFLFVWGSNSHGQLGLPKVHFGTIVKPVRLQVNACSVAMGLRHTAIVNSKGEVWTTGCGKYGQLGMGQDKESLDRFEMVPKVKLATHVACGQNHTLAWCSEEKALYVWGDNKHGQLILKPDKYKRIYDPQKIDLDVKQNVKKLLSGWTNALLWLEDGKLLTWGRNNYGQLGGDNNKFGIVNVSLPGGREIHDIVVGSEHTICLSSDNTLWGWGWNEHANTGTGLAESVFYPTLIEIDNICTEITQIHAGGGHNYIVTKESAVNSEKSDNSDVLMTLD